jgi:hypothetical protein
VTHPFTDYQPNLIELKTAVQRQYVYERTSTSVAPARDWTEPTKFDKLRIKTEKQLVQFINTELDLGIRDARQALKSADTLADAQECRRRANKHTPQPPA